MNTAAPPSLPNPAAPPAASVERLAPLLLCTAVAAVYAPLCTYPFTNWDEVQFVVNNPYLRPFTWRNLRLILTPGGNPEELLYTPTTYLSLMTEIAVFGLNSKAMHAVSVAVHLVNTLLAYAVIRRLGNAWRTAVTGALLFALHPLQVEAVAWIMGRKDLLACTFALAAILAYVRHLRQPHRYMPLLVGMLATLSMLAKPVTIVLPALLLLCDVRAAGRIRKQDVWGKLPYLVVAAGVLLLNPHQGPLARQIPPLLFRVAMAPWVAAGWLQRLLLLRPPAPLYPWPEEVADATFYVGAALIAGLILTAAAWGWKRRGHPAGFGLAFTAVAALPAATIVLRYERFTTADRYGYLPLLGIFLAAAGAPTRLHGRARRAASALLCLWLAGAVVRTIAYVPVWRNSIALWQHVIERHPNDPVTLNNLGMAYLDAGRTADGIRFLTDAIGRRPTDSNLRLNLGRALLDAGRLDRAEHVLRDGLRLDPDNARAYKNLGDVQQARGQPDAAIASYRRAAELAPRWADVYGALGALLLTRGEAADARRAFERELQLAPYRAAAHFNLGMAAERMGAAAVAIQAYETAVRLDPSLADAHFNLGNLCARAGKAARAEQAYSAAIHLRPTRADVQINLGNLYVAAGKLAPAVQAYTNALALASAVQAAGIRFNLGLIEAARKNDPAAVAYFSRALAENPALAPAHLELAAALLRLGKPAPAREHAAAAQRLGLTLPAPLAALLDAASESDPAP